MLWWKTREKEKRKDGKEEQGKEGKKERRKRKKKKERKKKEKNIIVINCIRGFLTRTLNSFTHTFLYRISNKVAAC
jgi:hypothetical protein